MTTTTSGHNKKWSARVALVGAGGLAMGALAFGAAAPAQADTGVLSYACTTPLGDATFTATLSATDLPTDLKVGETSDPVTITSNVTATGQATTLRLLAKKVGGTAEAKSTFGGVEQTGELTIPKTNIPAEGADLNTTASGQIQLKPTKAGDLKLVAGDFTTTIHAYGDDDSEVEVPGLLPANISCTLNGDQDATIATVTVGEADTTPPTTEPPATEEPPATTPEEPTGNTNVPTSVPAGMVSASDNQGSNTGELLLIGAGVAALGAAGVGGRLMLKREKN